VSTPARGALVVGESLVDVVTDPAGEVLDRAAGGSPLNVAVGLARLGVPTTLATCLGDDELGALVRSHAAGSGVTLTPGSVGRHPTGTATARLDPGGAAAYVFALHWELARPAVDDDLLVVHVGSLGTVLEPGATTVRAIAAEAASRGIPLSYDPNIRPAISPDGPATWSAVRRVAELSLVVKVSEEDLDHLQPRRDVSDVLDELVGRGRTALAVCTLGRGGALARSEAAGARVAAPAVDVVDTVGAGDSFMAALLVALADLGWLGEPQRALGKTDLQGLLRSAAAAAALTCARRGADPPRRTELGPHWPYRPS